LKTIDVLDYKNSNTSISIFTMINVDNTSNVKDILHKLIIL